MHGPVDEPLSAHQVLRPSEQTLPLVVASPHSGRDYPEPFVAASRLDPHTLRRSEDCYVDELFAGSVTAGAPMIRALFPRAYVDANRERRTCSRATRCPSASRGPSGRRP